MTSSPSGHLLHLFVVNGESLNLLDHLITSLDDEVVDIRGGHASGINGREDLLQYVSFAPASVSLLSYLDLDGTRLERPPLQVQNMAIVLDNNRDNWNLSLNRQMESSLLEREHIRFDKVRAGTLREDPHRLLILLHLLDRAGKGLKGILAVGAVDEDGSGEGHW